MIVAGGCRGRRLASSLIEDGHAVRISTRSESGREAIERIGAECWIGTPDRLATLRGALDGVTIACWLLGSARGAQEQLQALHGSRLRSFIAQAIDSTMRGFVYEGAGSVAAAILAEGEQIAVQACSYNEIPLAVLRTDPAESGWQREARYAVSNLLKTDRVS
jgi:uncharacterized protein YbjT (DUF2867 family)